MIQWILSNIVCHEFDKGVGKGHRFKNPDGPVPSMHIAWEISPYADEEKGPDGEQAFQYKRVHMVICGPCNYVYVATQEEVIDMAGEQSFSPLQVICYHDSCWRDSIQTFICKNARALSSARSSESLFDWKDEIELSIEEVEYLGKVETWRRDHYKDPAMPPELVAANPIQKRWERD